MKAALVFDTDKLFDVNTRRVLDRYLTHQIDASNAIKELIVTRSLWNQMLAGIFIAAKKNPALATIITGRNTVLHDNLSLHIGHKFKITEVFDDTSPSKLAIILSCDTDHMLLAQEEKEREQPRET